MKIATKKDILNLRQDLINEFTTIVERHVKSEKEWLRSHEIKKLLGISTGTLQNLITKGTLKPKKIGGILYFSMSDIRKLLK